MGKVDDAIKATEGSAPPVAQLHLAFTTGRPAALLLPTDLTLQETLELAAFVTAGLQDELARRRRPVSRLVVASGPLRRQ